MKVWDTITLPSKRHDAAWNPHNARAAKLSDARRKRALVGAVLYNKLIELGWTPPAAKLGCDLATKHGRRGIKLLAEIIDNDEQTSTSTQESAS